MTDAVQPVPGFFEEADRSHSMTRLIAFMLACGALLIIIAAAVVGVRGGDGTLTTIGALTAPLIPIVTGIWAALKQRERE